MLDQNYVPSNEDVLRARLRTTGIEEANFVFEDFAFCMIDVGGAYLFVVVLIILIMPVIPTSIPLTTHPPPRSAH